MRVDIAEPWLQVLAGELVTKVERAELAITGKFFAEEEEVQIHKGWWLRGRKFSVSKLAIALSDYVFVLWLSLVLAECLHRYAPACAAAVDAYGLASFVAFSFIYLLLLFIFGRKSPSPPANDG